MTKKELKPIKKIAGELLIYLYNRERSEAFALKSAMLRFNDALTTVSLEGKDEFTKVLLYAANDSSADAYNALEYLSEQMFIEARASRDSGGVMMHGFHVTSRGVDIIEGIEQDQQLRNQFNITFNFKLAENINVDALVKNEIESLVKASVL